MIHPDSNQHGAQHDLIKAWRYLYKAKGWDRFATFDTKGDLNTPYIMFKEKNIREPDVRAKKLFKVRPICPGTRHQATRQSWTCLVLHSREHLIRPVPCPPMRGGPRYA